MSTKNNNILLHVILLLLSSALVCGVFPLIKMTEKSITTLTLTLSRALLSTLVGVWLVNRLH